LAIAIVAPALDAVVIELRTGMRIPCHNRCGGAANTEVDDIEGSHTPRGVATYHGVVITQLPRIIPSPTLDAPIIKEDTGMATTSSDGLSSAPTTDINRHKGCHTPRRIASRDGIVVAQLPKNIPSPTLDATIIEQGTGMIHASRN
jgi:hypothetical protein